MATSVPSESGFPLIECSHAFFLVIESDLPPEWLQCAECELRVLTEKLPEALPLILY